MIPIFFVLLMQSTLAALGANGHQGAAAPTVPGLVNFRGAPSTEGTLVGAQTATICAANAYCTQLVDPTVSGNTILVIYTYQHLGSTVAEAPTVTDDKSGGSSTYTCVAEANDANATNRTFLGMCYSIGVAANIRNIKLTFPISGLDQVAAAVSQWYNLTAFDVTLGNGTQTAGTTFTSGSITPTANNDLLCEATIGTSTRNNVTAYTVGSQAAQNITWTMHLADLRDAMAVQCGVQTTATAINPQLTGQSNAFAALGIAFKAGLSGSAPSGMYIAHIYTVSSATGLSAGTITYQVPVVGNLLAGLETGAVLYPSAISDSLNGSWKECGSVQNFAGPGFGTSAWYVLSTQGLDTVTITTSVLPGQVAPGDIGPFYFVDIVGAAATQQCARNAVVQNSNTTGTTLVVHPAFVPSSSAGLELFVTSVAFNTMVGFNQPSNGSFDANTYGAMSLSGPEPVDENNGIGHLYVSSNAATPLTWNVGSSSTAVASAATEPVAFQAPGATVYPVDVQHAGNTTTTVGTSLAISSYTPYKSGDLIAVMQCGNTSGTFSISDGTNGYTAVDNKSTTNIAGVFCETWYTPNISASTITITGTYPAGSGFKSLMIEEFTGITHGLDSSAHNLVGATSAANGVITGTSVTPSNSAGEIFFEGIICANTCDLSVTGHSLTAGVNLAPWSILGADGGGNVTGYLPTQGTATVAAGAWDNSGSASEVTAIIGFY